MAVADTKLEKREGTAADAAAPSLAQNAFGWGPRKLAELRLFLTEVKAELKKVTWPSRQEVQSTTVVVIFTTVLFGFYLYGMDLGFSWLLSHILK